MVGTSRRTKLCTASSAVGSVVPCNTRNPTEETERRWCWPQQMRSARHWCWSILSSMRTYEESWETAAGCSMVGMNGLCVVRVLVNNCFRCFCSVLDSACNSAFARSGQPIQPQATMAAKNLCWASAAKGPCWTDCGSPFGSSWIILDHDSWWFTGWSWLPVLNDLNAGYCLMMLDEHLGDDSKGCWWLVTGDQSVD